MHADHQSDQTPSAGPPETRSTDTTSAERRTGRHRAVAPPRRGRALLASTPVRAAMATGVACCLGAVAFIGIRDTDEPLREPVAEAIADRVAAAEEQAASRSLDRTASPTPASPSPSVKPSPSATRTPTKKKSTTPRRPTPVAGLTQTQMDNATIIVDVGVALKMPRRAQVIAVATALQESNLYNLASDVLPESHRYTDEGSGSDHDSVGLFQQRPSSGWGTVRELMRPSYAARAFYEALRKVPGWQEMSLTGAAQAVQVSAFPDAYARHEQRATAVVAALR